MSITIAILGLAVLVLLHEAGHFFVARMVGMSPRRFYLGFPPALVKVRRKGIEYGVLQREVDSNRQIYDSLMTRTKETGITSEQRASNVRVVDPAVTPGMAAEEAAHRFPRSSEQPVLAERIDRVLRAAGVEFARAREERDDGACRRRSPPLHDAGQRADGQPG